LLNSIASTVSGVKSVRCCEKIFVFRPKISPKYFDKFNPNPTYNSGQKKIRTSELTLRARCSLTLHSILVKHAPTRCRHHAMWCRIQLFTAIPSAALCLLGHGVKVLLHLADKVAGPILNIH